MKVFPPPPLFFSLPLIGASNASELDLALLLLFLFLPFAVVRATIPVPGKKRRGRLGMGRGPTSRLEHKSRRWKILLSFHEL